jgi:hypothetical protein|tara:strand:+ start:82 stop:315 length:234 start_codon:yes stop_codon:yes gene_type:complete
MKHLKVEGHNNLLRDGDTGAIINNDKSGYSSYMMNKSIKDEESIRIQNVEQDLANIQNEISELKSLLKEALYGSRQN